MVMCSLSTRCAIRTCLSISSSAASRSASAAAAASSASAAASAAASPPKEAIEICFLIDFDVLARCTQEGGGGERWSQWWQWQWWQWKLW